MDQCKIVEDLFPLYEEGLVQQETKVWVEQHLVGCPKCAQLAEMDIEAITPVVVITPAEKIIAKTRLKLSIYQLLFVVLSFVFAMNTTIFTNKGFHFILSYFILGAVVYGFYRNGLLTITLSFVPIFVWTIYDAILSYGSVGTWWKESLHYEGPANIVIQLLLAGVFTALFHTLFAFLGALFIQLLKKAFQKEEGAP